MKRRIFSLISATLFIFNLQAQEIKTPSEFLGYEPGERFTFHHLIDGYFRYIGESSASANYLQYGVTAEGRPLSVCIVSSPSNLENLEKIRVANLRRAGLAAGDPETESVPVVWLAYNVHGSEPAGAEAAVRVLYDLVSGKYPGSEEWLKNLVIIIDPCQNPDGRDLFTTRYLRAQAFPPSADANAWEHNQGWPSARLNHYLFDLNRDWSWHVQMETRARMKLYNSFMPQVHADFHEMGAGSTYFLPPGAEPWHETITQWQRDFHKKAGVATAALFDKAGRLYYSADNFDLFCPSFGDTWPLFNGAMGFTLEQGGGAQAGLAFDRDRMDTLTLKQRADGHYMASMAMISVANENRSKLLSEFFTFFHTAATEPTFKYKTVLIKGTGDAASLQSLKELLEGNQIRYASPKVTGKKLKAYDYRADKEGSVTAEANDIVISAYQPQSRLMQVLFEPDSYASDSVSYDLTAWSIPYVYNLEAYATEERMPEAEPAKAAVSSGEQADSVPAYAWAVPGAGFSELKFMAQLYRKGVNVRYGTKPFTAAGVSFGRGSVIIARGDNMRIADLDASVRDAALKAGVTAVRLNTGLVTSGKDLGSDYSPVSRPPVIALVGGEGSSQSFGEIWFFMERELEYPVTLINISDLAETKLSGYDIIILAGVDMTPSKDKIMAYLKEGGRVIALESSISVFKAEKTTELGKASEARDAEEKKTVKVNPTDTLLLRRYEDQRRNSAAERSAGAIFRVRLDDSNPYAFGMGKEWFLMKRSAGLPFLEKGYNIGYITDSKPVSGFAGYKYRAKIASTGVIASERIGEGEVIYISDDPYFRAYWKSGRVLLGNLMMR